MMSYFVYKLKSLRLGCMVNAALEYAAAMTMSGNFNTVFSYSIIDELGLVE
jgi:hypothetical protein